MRTNSRITKLIRSLRGFRDGSSGNTTIFFALAMLPVVGLLGAAVDYSRASNMRTAMQAAVDTTALAIATNAASQSADQLNSSAASFFKALFTRPDAQNLQVAATYSSTNGTSVIVNASASMKTSFMGVVGLQTVPVAASGTAAWGMSRLRVALVLDNTGSMASAGKITALKTAAKNLITQLKGADVNNGDVYVSIIPFSKDVNASSANYGQSWVGWKLWDAVNGTTSSTSTSTSTSSSGSICWNGTTYTWNGSTFTAGGSCSTSTTTSTSASTTNRSTWNGCVTDRDQD